MTTKTTRPPVDQADVEAVLELEPMIRQLLSAIEAREAALDRLAAAEYPGADAVSGGLGHFWDRVAGADERPVNKALASLGCMRLAGGDQAAYDYHCTVSLDEMSIEEAAAEIFEGNHDLERVEAFKEYAARRGNR